MDGDVIIAVKTFVYADIMKGHFKQTLSRIKEEEQTQTEKSGKLQED